MTQNNNPWRVKAKLKECDIWENFTLRLIVEAYPLTNFNQIRSSHLFHTPHVVECLGTDLTQKYLFIERIPQRFSDLHSINQVQAVKIAYSIFKAMLYLRPAVGFFRITQECICFTSSGKVKIWPSSNLSLTIPEKPFNHHKNASSFIIKEVLAMIEKKCINKFLFDQLKIVEEQYNSQTILLFKIVAEQLKKLAENLFLNIDELQGEKPVENMENIYSKSQKNKQNHSFRDQKANQSLKVNKKQQVSNLSNRNIHKRHRSAYNQLIVSNTNAYQKEEEEFKQFQHKNISKNNLRNKKIVAPFRKQKYFSGYLISDEQIMERKSNNPGKVKSVNDKVYKQERFETFGRIQTKVNHQESDHLSQINEIFQNELKIDGKQKNCLISSISREPSLQNIPLLQKKFSELEHRDIERKERQHSDICAMIDQKYYKYINKKANTCAITSKSNFDSDGFHRYK